MKIDINIKDDCLISEFCNGNREAFNVIFRRYYGKVNCFIKSIIKDDNASEDLSQDIFIKLWTCRSSMKNIHSLNSFIYVMSRNSAIDYIRTSKDFVLLEKISDIYTNTETEENFFATEKELLIRLVVSQMPAKRRLIFEMSRYKGMTNEEIAHSFGISKKTVENHISSALKELRHVIELFTGFFLINL